MLVEDISDNGANLFVGIAELKNVRHKTRDELIRDTTERPEGVLALQMMDASCVAGSLHLLAAAQNAVNASRGGYSIARDLDVELIVYASAQRQIARAFERMGLRDALDYVSVVVISRTSELARDTLRRLVALVGPERTPPFPPSSERFERVKAVFEIKDVEVDTIKESDQPEAVQNALSRCVAGRVSLVAVED